MTYLVRYWKESLLVALLCILIFGYYLNVQSAKEVQKLETQIELQQKQKDRGKKIDKAISNSTNSVADELQYLRDRQAN